MSTSRWHYVKELSEQLRINGVPEEKVRDIVAQVESHVSATREDPVDVFGQPADYANEWQRLTPRHWATQVALGIIPAIGIAAGIRALFADTTWASALGVRVDDVVRACWLGAIMSLLPWTTGLIESRRRAVRLGGPRPPSTWPLRLATAVAAGVAVATVIWVIGEDGLDRVLFDVPRWSLVVVAVLTIGSVWFVAPAPNSASGVPRPPGTPDPSWRTRLRRLFLNR